MQLPLASRRGDWRWHLLIQMRTALVHSLVSFTAANRTPDRSEDKHGNTQRNLAARMLPLALAGGSHARIPSH